MFGYTASLLIVGAVLLGYSTTPWAWCLAHAAIAVPVYHAGRVERGRGRALFQDPQDTAQLGPAWHELRWLLLLYLLLLIAMSIFYALGVLLAALF